MKTVKERKAAVERKSLQVGNRGDDGVVHPTRQALQTDKPAGPAPKPVETPGVRTELIQRVRAEIQAGTYETPQKLQVAIDRLLEDLHQG